MNKDDQIDILLIEDNDGDIRLAKEALASSKLNNILWVVKNGEEALDFLFRRGDYHDSTRPDLILLDLNLPKIDGRTVLKRIKSDNDLKKIPVVILTTSNSEDDIIATYSDHANSFITKPINWEQFINVVQSIEDFWLTIVKLPSKHAK